MAKWTLVFSVTMRRLNFIDPTKGGSLTREIANALADTLGRDIWAEIQFNDEHVATNVELQEFNIEESGEP
ncbi:MAG: hypothetical protein ACREA3_06645 [Nitrosotalea sp.]